MDALPPPRRFARIVIVVRRGTFTRGCRVVGVDADGMIVTYVHA